MACLAASMRISARAILEVMVNFGLKGIIDDNGKTINLAVKLPLKQPASERGAGQVAFTCKAL